MKLKILKSMNISFIEEEVAKYWSKYTVSKVTYSTEVVYNDIVYVAFIEYVEQDQILLVEDLNLSHRATWCMRRNGIQTIDQLRHIMSTGEIKHFRNLGPKTIAEIEDKLWELDKE